MPYVLTSKKWRVLFRNKEEKKAEEERKKEERKRKREMNNGGKIAKRKRSVESTKHVKHGRKVTELSTLSSHENPKDSSLITVSLSYDQNVQATTSSGIGTNILEKRKDTSEEPNKLLSSGLCYTCGGCLNNEWLGISCKKCLKVFHKKCLQNEFSDNDSEDENVYFCNKCVRELDDSESD